MLVEVAGGIYAHSLAIVTDAAHLLSDVSGFAVSAFAAFYAAKRSHQHFSYGYHRIEVLGALASILSVWLVTGILLWEAVQRIINPEPVNGKGKDMLIWRILIYLTRATTRIEYLNRIYDINPIYSMSFDKFFLFISK